MYFKRVRAYWFDLIAAVTISFVLIGLVTWSWPFNGSAELKAITFLLAFFIAIDLRDDRAKRSAALMDKEHPS